MDLAFHRYDFRTNSGESGRGQGGAFITTEKDVAASIAQVDGSNFVTDEMSVVLKKFSMASMEGGGMQYKEEPTNTLLSAKYVKDGDGKFQYNAMGMPEKVKEHKGLLSSAGMPPEVTMKEEVFLVRCADGSVARVKLLDWQDDKAKTGHIKFQYVYPAWE